MLLNTEERREWVKVSIGAKENYSLDGSPNKMVADKMVWTKWHGQNGIRTKWYGQMVQICILCTF